MKQKIKKALAMLLIMNFLFNIAPLSVFAEMAPAEKLDQIMANEYPEGSVFSDRFDGGIGCFGFAKMIINKLFGPNSNGRVRSWNYAGESTTGMMLLGRLKSGEYTADNMRALMQKAKPGCVIQRDVDASGGSQHSMIFLSAGTDSFRIYDCNAYYDNVVHIREIGYDSWEARTFLSVSVLISDNYLEGGTIVTPSDPIDVPQGDADITSQLNSLMATTYPMETKFCDAVCGEDLNYTFAKRVLTDVWKDSENIKPTWNTSATELYCMELIGQISYGDYEYPERVKALCEKAQAGDVIQLDKGSNDRAHCMIYLSRTNDGIWILDADRQDDGIIRKRFLGYATRFHRGTWAHISLLRASKTSNNIPSPPPTNAEPTPENPSFIDVPDVHWAHTYITDLTDRGILRGKDPTHFAPEDTITRAELISMLARTCGVDANSTGKTKFKDIQGDEWYAAAVVWAHSQNIARGDSSGYFYPDIPVTREDLAVMLTRYLESGGYTITGTQVANTFYDRGTISAYARDSVDSLQRAGILSGKRDDYFAPKDNATRAETAKVLYKLLRYIN